MQRCQRTALGLGAIVERETTEAGVTRRSVFREALDAGPRA